MGVFESFECLDNLPVKKDLQMAQAELDVQAAKMTLLPSYAVFGGNAGGKQQAMHHFEILNLDGESVGAKHDFEVIC